MGVLLAGLYNKLSMFGAKEKTRHQTIKVKLNAEDWKTISKIRELVLNIPPLELPVENAYIILEMDGCM